MGESSSPRRASSDTVLPVSNQPVSTKSGLHPSIYILNWVFFSNATILFNKWLLDSFKYPVILTAWHLIFATVATQILARTTSLLDSRSTIPLTGKFYLRTILPIGILYTGSLVCSNQVYMYLSLPFIQMLKAGAPVAVLFTSWAWGVAEPDMAKLINVVVIVIGVAVASFGEVKFSWIGFFYQAGGIVFESMRIVMIQVMLAGEGLRMDPLVGLYYYAPVCAVLNTIAALVSEAPKFKVEDLANTGITMLILNASVAFGLNIASVSLIGKTSGLVLTLTGILKSILLVIIAVIIWQTPISGLQALGYTIAVFGLAYYSLGKDQVVALYQMTSDWLTGNWSQYSKLEGGSPGTQSVLTKRYLVVIVLGVTAVFGVIFLAVAGPHGGLGPAAVEVPSN